MKIHEYQAKEILKSYGVPVPRGGLAKSAEEAGKIAAELGGAGVVKAQIHAGGRGKGVIFRHGKIVSKNVDESNIRDELISQIEELE